MSGNKIEIQSGRTGRQEPVTCTIQTLEQTERKALHDSFVTAFSDYPANIPMSLSAHQHMLTRRGYYGRISVGAFSEPEHTLIGFIFNGLRSWQGKLTAYDTGTGVAQAFRRQGLTNQMFHTALKLLSENRVQQYLLEVLRENTAAYELYKNQGFTVSREFSCWRLDRENFASRTPAFELHCSTSFDENDWSRLQTFWDFTPSWQNSVDSLKAVDGSFVYVSIQINNQAAGYGVVEKATGDVPQIAVHKDFRRKGIATEIVGALLEHTTAGRLQLINVDEACEGMALFLENTGFAKFTRQYEMVLAIK